MQWLKLDKPHPVTISCTPEDVASHGGSASLPDLILCFTHSFDLSNQSRHCHAIFTPVLRILTILTLRAPLFRTPETLSILFSHCPRPKCSQHLPDTVAVRSSRDAHAFAHVVAGRHRTRNGSTSYDTVDPVGAHLATTVSVPITVFAIATDCFSTTFSHGCYCWKICSIARCVLLVVGSGASRGVDVIQ